MEMSPAPSSSSVKEKSQPLAKGSNVPFPVIYKVPVQQIPVVVQQKVDNHKPLRKNDMRMLLDAVYNHVTASYARGL